MKIEQNTTKKKVEDIQNEFSSVKFEINRLEQYSRKSSIRVYGIEESQEEKVGEKALSKIQEEINVEISPDDVDIVHRVGKRSEEGPRSILVKFSSHKPKERVLTSKNHPKNTRISEDLAARTRTMPQANKVALNIEKMWTLDGKMKYKFINSDRILEIRSSDDFKKLMGLSYMAMESYELCRSGLHNETLGTLVVSKELRCYRAEIDVDGLDVQIYDTLERFDVLEVLESNVLIDITETRYINPSTSKSKEGNQRSEGKININVRTIANSKL